MADRADQSDALIDLDQRLALEKTARQWEPQRRDAQGNVRCRECAEPIQPERLRANPAAVRCIDCQAHRERQERLYG